MHKNYLLELTIKLVERLLKTHVTKGSRRGILRDVLGLLNELRREYRKDTLVAPINAKLDSETREYLKRTTVNDWLNPDILTSVIMSIREDLKNEQE